MATYSTTLTNHQYEVLKKSIVQVLEDNAGVKMSSHQLRKFLNHTVKMSNNISYAARQLAVKGVVNHEHRGEDGRYVFWIEPTAPTGNGFKKNISAKLREKYGKPETKQPQITISFGDAKVLAEYFYATREQFDTTVIDAAIHLGDAVAAKEKTTP